MQTIQHLFLLRRRFFFARSLACLSSQVEDATEHHLDLIEKGTNHHSHARYKICGLSRISVLRDNARQNASMRSGIRVRERERERWRKKRVIFNRSKWEPTTFGVTWKSTNEIRKVRQALKWDRELVQCWRELLGKVSFDRTRLHFYVNFCLN